MLKTVRLTLAILCFLLITFLFLDFTGTAHVWLGWLAKTQFLPALLALNVGVIAGLILLTLLFGRIYCSVICPLGVFQDTASWLAQRIRKKRKFTFSPAVSWLRYGVLVLCIAAFVFGISSLVALFDPYGTYGRMAGNLFLPVYRGINNVLASLAERMDGYAFYPTEVWIKSSITLSVAIASFLIVGVLAWRNGRTYCNTVCPVGTVLGFLSRFSLFRLTLDTEKCTKCGLCTRGCKASCIDSKKMSVDYSRCVSCFNCMEKCKFGAIGYLPRYSGRKLAPLAEKEDKKGISRIKFLSVAGFWAFAGVTAKAQQLLQADGGLADIADKKAPDRKVPLVPPGAQSLRNFNSRCTACQLCVSACPNQILRPSGKLSSLMQPEMSYEQGYCRPECTECSQVCPAGAIKAVTPADKSSLSIGRAVWIKDNCIVHRDDLQCTACQRHCPTSAITLIAINPDDKKSLKYPAVDNELCIGCGSCEYYCPARPFSAIYVEGNLTHHSV
ncbi:MAG: 4Fe-4S dicluster domain-containing protein [Tannerella sp.]|jgi:ferredoxin|nr:4Fe-4S dicluster domain-containing protein [Tannerella sp.]